MTEREPQLLADGLATNMYGQLESQTAKYGRDMYFCFFKLLQLG